MAACIREGLKVVAAAGIKAKVEMPVPPAWVPFLLGLPNRDFRVAARPMVKIGIRSRARRMWDDLERGRKTEIDALNGEIVRLAARLGLQAPVNAAITRLVKAAEGKGSPRLGARELLTSVSAG